MIFQNESFGEPDLSSWKGQSPGAAAGGSAAALALIVHVKPTYLTTGAGERIPHCDDYPTEKNRDINPSMCPQWAITWEPLTVGSKYPDHVASVQCSAGKPTILASMQMLSDTKRSTPPMAPHSLMTLAPTTGRNVLPRHKNCSGTAQAPEITVQNSQHSNLRTHGAWLTIHAGPIMDHRLGS